MFESIYLDLSGWWVRCQVDLTLRFSDKSCLSSGVRLDDGFTLGFRVEESLVATCISLISLLIALSMSAGNFSLMLSVVFLESMFLNLTLFVRPGVMVGRFGFRRGCALI